MNTNKRSLNGSLPVLWMESGLTQAEFCREHGISLSRLQYWRRKEDEGNRGTGPAFVPVEPIGSSASASRPDSVDVEIELPGQVRVRLRSGLSSSDLAGFIAELRRAC